jgi:hypothetical protein
LKRIWYAGGSGFSQVFSFATEVFEYRTQAVSTMTKRRSNANKKNAPGNVALPAGSMPTDLALRLVSETGAVEGGEDGTGAAEN